MELPTIQSYQRHGADIFTKAFSGCKGHWWFGLWGVTTVWIAGWDAVSWRMDPTSNEYPMNGWFISAPKQRLGLPNLGSHLNSVWGLLLVMLALEIWWHGWHVRVTVIRLYTVITGWVDISIRRRQSMEYVEQKITPKITQKSQLDVLSPLFALCIDSSGKL